MSLWKLSDVLNNSKRGGDWFVGISTLRESEKKRTAEHMYFGEMLFNEIN